MNFRFIFIFLFALCFISSAHAIDEKSFEYTIATNWTYSELDTNGVFAGAQSPSGVSYDGNYSYKFSTTGASVYGDHMQIRQTGVNLSTVANVSFRMRQVTHATATNMNYNRIYINGSLVFNEDSIYTVYTDTGWLYRTIDVSAYSGNNYNLTIQIYKGSTGGSTREFYFDIFDCEPTTPTLVSPSNNSIETSSPITLDVLSTDADDDSLTYYFYGGISSDSMIFLGYNDSIDGNTFNWSISQYNVYYWTCFAGDGHENSTNMTTAQFTLIVPPNLTSPSNTSTEYVTYPPLTSTISFYWQDVAAPQYRLMIAEDINFNIMAVDNHIGTNNSAQTLLVNKEYFWKVYSYNGTTYSDSSNVYSFNLTGNSTLSGSAIEGVAYADINGVNTALGGAEVSIWNTTWTDTAITGSNGYYLFTGVTSGQTYNVQAKKDLYLDSSVALITATSDPITQDFFLLPDRTSEEWRHYVKFIVWGPAGYYEDVTITVYENSDVTALYTKITENDGAVVFIMDRQQQYRVTAINAAQGIDCEMIVYPKDDKYLFFIASTGSWTTYDEPVDDVIGIDVSTEIINASAAWVNVSYTDTMSETTDATVFLNQTNSSDPYNQTVIDSQTGLTNNWTHSFIVGDYEGESYYVHVVATHTTYGAIDQTYAVQFDDDIGLPGLPDKMWLYVAILIMMFTAGMFGASTATEGAAIICVEGWVFLFFGWFSTIDNNGIIAVGLGFATVVAIIANINKFSKKEGHE